MEKIPYEKMISGDCNVILVKSTRYNDLMDAHLKAGTVAFFALSLDALGITFFK